MPGPSPTKKTTRNDDDWKLEPEFHEAYLRTRLEPGPPALRSFVETLRPTLGKLSDEIVGSSDPISISRARAMAIDALPNYDPRRAPLTTYLRQQLLPMRRQTRQATEVVRFPERQWFDSQAVLQAEQELSDSLGRAPSDAELASKLQFSLRRLQKARNLKTPMTGGQLEAIDPDLESSAVSLRPARDFWIDLVYEDLSPLDQVILEHTLGMRGKKQLSNAAIAAKLDRTPGYISQRKAVIQKRLDQERELSVYLP